MHYALLHADYYSLSAKEKTKQNFHIPRTNEESGHFISVISVWIPEPPNQFLFLHKTNVNVEPQKENEVGNKGKNSESEKRSTQAN